MNEHAPAHASSAHPVLRVVQISDIHLRPGDDDRLMRFHQIMEMISQLAPDCIILTGDLTEDGFRNIDDLAWARKFLLHLKMPVMIIPGNHDIGDRTGQSENPITAARLANWNSVFARDHFVHDENNWRLIGLDSLLIGTDLPEENQQLRWLDQQLDQAEQTGRHVAIFMHEPAFLGEPGKAFGNRSDYWPIAASRQMIYLKRFARPMVKLVASGHVHWHHMAMRNGTRHVWCPSPAFIVVDPQFPPGGEKAGFMLHELGEREVTSKLIELNRPDTPVIQFQPQSPEPDMVP